MSRSRIDTVRLSALLEGEVTASERRALEQELTPSSEARARLAELERIRDTLAAPVPEISAVDLVAGVRNALRRGEGPKSASPTRARRLVLGVAAAACAVAAAFVLVPRALEPEFRAKSNVGSEAHRWASIEVYRVGQQGVPQKLQDELASSDALLFSYTNLGAHPFSHLMVFSVDARGEVRWFHPAYEREGSDPASVPIAADAQVTLPELIEQDFPPGPLAIHALFSRRALRVSQVERWVADSRGALRAAPFADTHSRVVTVRVLP